MWTVWRWQVCRMLQMTVCCINFATQRWAISCCKNHQINFPNLKVLFHSSTPFKWVNWFISNFSHSSFESFIQFISFQALSFSRAFFVLELKYFFKFHNLFLTYACIINISFSNSLLVFCSMFLPQMKYERANSIKYVFLLNYDFHPN